MANSGYVEYVLDVLSTCGNIKAKKMFGGHGIYKDGIFFALIAGDCLYFKVDEHNLSFYKKSGSKPFSYEGKNKKMVVMSYWEVPADILENHNKLMELVGASVQAAKRVKKVKS